MKIRLRGRPVPLDAGACYFEFDADTLQIDGIPYVPPAPEPVQRWECEVVLCGYENGKGEAFAMQEHGWCSERARAALGFDAQGRVWMADQDAKRMAFALREWASNPKYGYFPVLLRDAADRLAGPEPDAT